MSPATVDAKRQRRRREREWRTSMRDESNIAYRKACHQANKAYVNSRSKYYRDRFDTNSADHCQRWTVIRDVLHQTESLEVHPLKGLRLCDGFSKFFAKKINNIIETIKSSLANKLCDMNHLQ